MRENFHEKGEEKLQIQIPLFPRMRNEQEIISHSWETDLSTAPKISEFTRTFLPPIRGTIFAHSNQRQSLLRQKRRGLKWMQPA